MRNDYIRYRIKVEKTAERCRKARLRWFGYVKRLDQEYVGRNTLEMVPPGKESEEDRNRYGWTVSSET